MPALTSNDKTILTIAGALLLLGTAGIGILEMIAGSPHPVSGEGQIVHEALVPLAIRSYIILLGFLLLEVPVADALLGLAHGELPLDDLLEQAILLLGLLDRDERAGVADRDAAVAAKQKAIADALAAAQEAIAQADHLVFSFPVWWGGLPAKMKGFFDRVFLPGFAYRWDEGGAREHDRPDADRLTDLVHDVQDVPRRDRFPFALVQLST